MPLTLSHADYFAEHIVPDGVQVFDIAFGVVPCRYVVAQPESHECVMYLPRILDTT